MRRDDEHGEVVVEPHLSVVIPCRNAEATIGEQLEALASEQWEEPWEVVVSDNGSADATRAIVAGFEARLPELRVVDSSDVRGPAHAMNVGAGAARGPLLAFCDADDVIGAGWLRAMGEALATHPFVAAAQETRRLNPDWISETRQSIDGVLPEAKFPPHHTYAGAGTIGVRKDTHQSIGGFDSEFGALFEIDYAFRLREKGIVPTLAPSAVVHYRWRRRLRDIYRQARWYADGRALLEKRYVPAKATPRRIVRWLAAGWSEVLAQVPQLTRKGGRAKMAWLLGWQAGRLHAAVKHRTLVV